MTQKQKKLLIFGILYVLLVITALVLIFCFHRAENAQRALFVETHDERYLYAETIAGARLNFLLAVIIVAINFLFEFSFAIEFYKQKRKKWITVNAVISAIFLIWNIVLACLTENKFIIENEDNFFIFNYIFGGYVIILWFVTYRMYKKFSPDGIKHAENEKIIR
jgi:hypothetical protein